MSLALARKYRPRRFADVAVQTHVATTLRNAIAHNRVASAYLFTGPRGTGKTTLARVLAMSLNCENRRADREPCGECTSCRQTWAGATSLDVIEIDAASNRTVNDARDLRERVMYAPSGDDRYKVYIVDEAHMLTKDAWNTLLKVIEEPPPRVVFVFATTDPQAIANMAAPVLSRVQRFDLRRLAPADIRARLESILAAEGMKAEPGALATLARAADGSMRDALTLTDQVLSLGTGVVTEDLVRETLGLVNDDEILALLGAVAEHRAADVFPAVARLADEGADFALLFAGLLGALRMELAVALGAEMPDLSERMREAIVASKGRFSPGDILRMLKLAVELEPHFKRSAQQQILFEMLLVRFAVMDRTVDLESVIRQMASQVGSGGSAAPERPREPRRVTEGEPRREATRSTGAAPVPAGAALADAPRPDIPRVAIDIERLSARWDDLVDAVRLAGRGLVASALAESTPTAVSNGIVTIQAPGDALGTVLEGGAEYVVAALRTMFTGATRLAVSAAAEGKAHAARMTEGDVVAGRVAMLRKEAPLLNAAFDLLDLRLVE
ncbi:MAG: DNA polymerase III subunit gamma/tau [Gemmatimonadaceae bacterium]|nr:DNA polymerase III subunit gamma/tau [Gemmatimonadaceae bacterium]